MIIYYLMDNIGDKTSIRNIVKIKHSENQVKGLKIIDKVRRFFHFEILKLNTNCETNQELGELIMSYKTGGEIEKGGNQYESLALIYFFAKLLNDEFIYVQSESFDEDLEQGTDIIIKDRKNKIFVVQVKSRDGINDRWNLNKLKKHSIIENACKHISNGRDFHLLSPLEFTAMQDWCTQSRGFDDFLAFEKFIIGKNKNSESSKLFEKIIAIIKSCWGTESPLKFFKHFYIDHLFDDKHFVIDFLASSGKITEPEKAFSLLDHYVTKYNKLNQQIYVSEIRNYLKKEGIIFFNIDNQAASLTLSDLQDNFMKNLKRKLINQKWLERKEFKKLIEILNNQKVAIISGQSGTGKSALIYELCNKLKSENKVFLPISFEVNLPSNNLFIYGKSLGFTASPTEVLKQLSNGEMCYLIIDQVDAIKWDQTDWNSAFDACCSLVEACNIIPNLKIIFACRTIDADKILKFWRTSTPKLSDCQICLSSLDADLVKSVIPAKKYQNLTQGVRELLRNARNLKMYIDICATKDYIPTNNIIHDYIEIKQREVQRKGFNTNEIIEFHEYLVAELKRNHITAIPLYRINDKFNSGIIHAFCSAGIIEQTSNNLIKFTHQSILDYYLVKDLISALDNGKSITSIIRQYNNHPLSNYEIIKQFIEACFDCEQYIDYLEQIIFCNNIRMIIKNIAIRALKTLKPSDKSNELYIKIIRSKHYGLKYLYFLSSGNQYFATYFIKQKEFTKLLRSDNHEDNLHVVDLLLQANNPDSIKLLTNYVNNVSDERILRLLIHNIDDVTAPDELFDLKIFLLRKNLYTSYYIDWEKIINCKSERIAQYLYLFLSNDCLDKNFIYDINSNTEIADAVKTDYYNFYNLSKKKIEAEFNYELYCDIISQYDHNKKNTAFIFETSLVYLPSEEIMALINSEKLFFKHTALRSLVKCGYNKGIQLFISLINEKFIAKQNYLHDRQLLEIVCTLLTKFSDKLSKSDLRNLENQINSYKSPSLIEFAKERFEERKSGYFYHYCEEEQKRFLECLPYNKITEFSKNYLLYLKRKFPQKEYFTWTPKMNQATTYTVVSCIATKWRCFSLKTWHQIMSNPKTGQKDQAKMVINDKGQAIEATLFEFCSTINTAAHAKPKLFVDLALKYNDLRLPFIEAICEGLYDYSENKEEVLEPCAPEQKLLVYKKYFDITNKRILQSFVWFVDRNNVMDSWIFEKLLEIANNPEKYEHDIINNCSLDLNHNLDNLTIHDIDIKKINRVQTCAINCIANTLFYKKEIDDNVKSILSKCLESSNPVMLFSAIDILYPVWNFDKDFVVDNLFTIYQKDLRTLASIKSIELLRCVIKNYHGKFYDVFEKAIQANDEEFEHVYQTVIATYCFYGYYKALVKLLAKNFNTLCMDTCTQILIDNTQDDILDRTRDLILNIQDVNQDEKNESEHLNSIIDHNLINNPKNHTMVLKAIRSKSFFNNTYAEIKFIYEIQEMPKLLPISKIIFAYCKSSFKFKNYRLFEIDKLVNIIIKLYLEANEANNSFLTKKCLKMLDSIYSNEVINNDIVILQEN